MSAEFREKQARQGPFAGTGAGPSIEACADVLARIAAAEAVSRGDRSAFLSAAVPHLADALGVECAEVWSLSGEEGLAVRLANVGAASGSPDCFAIQDRPEYCALLHAGRPVALSRSKGGGGDHVAAGAIDAAVLLAPMRLRGTLIGLIRYEDRTSVDRVWTGQDVATARATAELMALLIDEERTIWDEPEMVDPMGSPGDRQDLVEQLEDVLYVVELDGHVCWLNRAFERRLGWRREEWIGRHFGAFLHPDDLALAADVQERVLSGESHVSVELRFRHAEGRWIVGELRATARRTDGEITGVIGVGRDVTERSRSEARRQTLLDIACDVAGNLDVNTLLRRALRPTVDSLGCDGALVLCEEPETGDSRVIADLGFTEAESLGLRAIRFKRGVPLEGRLLRGETVVLADDRDAPSELRESILRPLRVRSLIAAPLYATGEFYGSLVAFSRRADAFDLFDVAQCEAISRLLTSAVGAAELFSMRDREHRLELAQVRLAEEMISSVDAPILLGRVCCFVREYFSCREVTAFLFGDDEGELAPVARDGGAQLSDEEFDSIRIPHSGVAGLLERLETDGVAHLRAGDPDGGRFLDLFGLRSAMVVGLRRGSRLLGMLSIGNASRSIGFDSGDERAARRLGHLAALGLSNARLFAELERANTLKSEFVATMSHELRTPLNVILGYADLLIDEGFGPLGKEQSETLERMSRSARGLCELVNATLDMSRLEAGRIELRPTDVDVSKLFREVVDAQKDRPTKIEFICEQGRGLGFLHTDGGKLKVALNNLLSNAFKFTEKGTVTFSVRRDDRGVEFSVRDTGPGIEEEMHDVVFESFRQGDGSASRRHGGAGLGLYIVRRLATLLGGHVTLESRVDEGATFRLWIPAAPLAVVAADA
jgi:PAS domain S-box-containing protein